MPPLKTKDSSLKNKSAAHLANLAHACHAFKITQLGLTAPGDIAGRMNAYDSALLLSEEIQNVTVILYDVDEREVGRFMNGSALIL